MKAIVLDDEKLLLEDLVEKLKKINVIEKVNGFLDEEDVLSYAAQNDIDVAFLDIQTEGMGGIALAENLMEMKPDINLIFVTAFSEFGLEAMRLHASGYLLKPPSVEDIERELSCLRNKPESGIKALTFGNFDITVNGNNISFGRRQAKEILAYLINICGRTATRKELASVIFEDRVYDRTIQKQLQNVIAELTSILKKNGIEEILIKGNNSYAINKDLFECDLYEFLKGNEKAIESYNGFYMENYSWAEEMKGVISEKKSGKSKKPQNT